MVLSYTYCLSHHFFQDIESLPLALNFLLQILWIKRTDRKRHNSRLNESSLDNVEIESSEDSPTSLESERLLDPYPVVKFANQNAKYVTLHVLDAETSMEKFNVLENERVEVKVDLFYRLVYSLLEWNCVLQRNSTWKD